MKGAANGIRKGRGRERIAPRRSLSKTSAEWILLLFPGSSSTLEGGDTEEEDTKVGAALSDT